MRLSNSAKMRTADHKAIHERGIASTVLMENAARHIVTAVQEVLEPDKSVALFCGAGNNGGDGIAAAYMLTDLGIEVLAYLIGDKSKLTPDAQEMEYRLGKRGARLAIFDETAELPSNCGAIVDAMFGIGLNSPIHGKALIATRLINTNKIPTISADLPSGVVCDTGYVHGEAVRADITITFSAGKPAHYIEPGCTYCGEIRVCDIGIPEDLLEEAYTEISVIQHGEITLPKRSPLTHKYNYGRAMILGGAVGYSGAVSLATKAALRTGAGVVFTGVPNSIYPIVASKNEEAVIFPLIDEAERFCTRSFNQVRDRLSAMTSIVIGVGISRGMEVSEFVYSVMLNARCPLVIDADGLFALREGKEIINLCTEDIILTPHEGEFKTIGGVLTDNRIADLRIFLRKYRCILLLKGHHPMVAFPDGDIYICPYGNAGMAKGGSGDVLAGIIGAMLGILPIKQAVLTAMYIHATAGDMCAEKFGEYSMLPSDMINCICEITKNITER